LGYSFRRRRALEVDNFPLAPFLPSISINKSENVMKKILAERIHRLDTLLVNKETELQGNEHFANSPFTQSNINNLREEIYKEKLHLERSVEDHTETKTFEHFKKDLDSLEKQINELRIM
jgi:hypothetical protein